MTIVLTYLMTRVLELDTLALDLESRLRGSRAQDDVAIVLITEDDYLEYFKQRSPLDPSKVGEIIDAIAAAEPRVIGVDIDTSDPAFKDLEAKRAWPRIVWGHGLINPTSDEKPFQSDHVAHRCLRTADRPSVDQLVPGAARGTEQSQLLAMHDAGSTRRADALGLWIANIDSDGLIRRYQRCWKTRSAIVPSLPWALSAPTANPECASPADQRSRPIKYTRNAHRWCYSAEDVLTADWQRNSTLKGKIVLLGGSYAAARDEHATPLGMMLGVEIIANAVETELMGGGAAAPDWLNLLIGILDGYLILWFFYRLEIRMALLCSFLATVAIVAVVGAFSPGSWLYVSMVCVAVAGYQLADVVSDYRTELIRRVIAAPSTVQAAPEAAPAPRTGARIGWGLAIVVAFMLVLGRRNRNR